MTKLYKKINIKTDIYPLSNICPKKSFHRICLGKYLTANSLYLLQCIYKQLLCCLPAETIQLVNKQSHSHTTEMNNMQLIEFNAPVTKPTYSPFWKATTAISWMTNGSSGAMLRAWLKKRSANFGLLVRPYSRPIYSMGK